MLQTTLHRLGQTMFDGASSARQSATSRGALFSRAARVLGMAALFAASTPSLANIVYQFSFTGISGGRPDFGVTLEFSDYVTTTGMQAVVPTFQNSFASVGYAVNYAGTNKSGYWAFDDDTFGVLNDSGYSYGGASFLFEPDLTPVTGYFEAPGVYLGRKRAVRGGGVVEVGVVGNDASGSFSGSAVLTVRDTNQNVPEPGSIALALLALGAAGAATIRRRAA